MTFLNAILALLTLVLVNGGCTAPIKHAHIDIVRVQIFKVRIIEVRLYWKNKVIFSP